MKNIIFALAIAAILFLASCGHNVSQLELGKLASIGSPEYGKAKYMEGLSATTVGRENIRIAISIDSTVGITLDPGTNSLKGIEEITIETGPQYTGYIKDASEPVAVAYFDAVAAYYQARKEPTTISAEKSSKATASIADTIKAAIAMVRGKVADSEPFECKDGNCDVSGLKEKNTIDFQAAVASKLLTYADSSEEQTGETPTNYENLVEYISRLARLKAEGKTTTRIVVDSAKIRDGKIAELSFLWHYDDGTYEPVTCVGCMTINE